jgi:hypothetical protein
VFLAIALISASASSDEPVVALAIEPEVVSAPVATLESAARANDFATFDALYRANPDPAYRTLHELWSYSMTDRTGAFYGNEQYERLARAYPGYAEYIAHYRIVDSHGAVFYPASETRAFLLEQRSATTASPAAPAKKKARVTLLKQAHAAPVVKPPLPPVRKPKPAAPAAAPAEDLALLTTTVSVPAPAQAIAAPSPVTETTVPAPAKETNRGLLLVIIGLVGVGLLALIVRAPREVIP